VETRNIRHSSRGIINAEGRFIFRDLLVAIQYLLGPIEPYREGLVREGLTGILEGGGA
jgi:hypothetical protein